MGSTVRSRVGAVGLAAALAAVLAGCAGSPPATGTNSLQASAMVPSPTPVLAASPVSMATAGVTIVTRSGSLRNAAAQLVREQEPASCLKEVTADPDPSAIAATLAKAQTSGSFADGRGWVGSMVEAVVGLGGTQVLVSDQGAAPVWLVGTSAAAARLAAVPAGSLVAIELRPYQVQSGLTAWLATGNAEAAARC
jgi:hypothetical protein